MNIPDEFKYDTLSELMEKRTEITARPFPQGRSGDERMMTDAVEEHCANHFMEALEALERSLDDFYELAVEDESTYEEMNAPDSSWNKSHAILSKLKYVQGMSKDVEDE